MTVFESRMETLTAEDREQIQLERLQALLARLKRNVRRYRDQLANATVESLDDVETLPQTSPEALVEAFPYGMFALPLREVIRLHSTVGPEGKQLVIGHTRNDLRQWARLTARLLVAGGVTSHDVLQICFQGGSFGQSLGFMLGAELIGASVIPEDPFHIEYQLEVLRNYRATVLVTTPANARELVDLLENAGIDAQSLHLRTLFLSRPVAPETREELETGLFAQVRCCFGVPETLDPGLCVDCGFGHFHLNEDHFAAEVCDGELLVTTLTREAMPLLRYRTRIACRVHRSPCECGRTGLLLEPGERLDGRFLVNEMPLYRSQLAAVLAKTRVAGQPFRIEVDEKGIIVEIEVAENFFGDEMRVLADLRNDIRTEFLDRLGIAAEVRYVAPSATGRPT